MTLQFVLLVCAIILFLLAGFGVGHPRLDLTAFGLAALAGAMLPR